ncbi:MAG: hypothetical protein AAGE52_25995 [Myxococcota bacterium]
MIGARITDAVKFYAQRGENRGAVRIVRQREPDKFRWRKAVSGLSSRAGKLRGRDRMRIEEPVREVVVDLDDAVLRREVVLDARRWNVDLDRGEVLPFHRMGDLRRYAFLVGADMRVIERYVDLPIDFDAPVDTAACTLVSRAMANHYRRRAQRIWLELPDPDSRDAALPQHRFLADRASREAELARRWGALGQRLVEG